MNDKDYMFTDDIFVTFELDPVFLSLKELVSQNFIAASTNQNLNCYILHKQAFHSGG